MKINLPASLNSFIANGGCTLYCDDGDWDLRIVPAEDSPFQKELPKRSVMIAENGYGDCLFLKAKSNDSFGEKVFVFWHEEDRFEMFAPNLALLIESAATKKQEPPEKKLGRKPISLAQLEQELANAKPDSLRPSEVMAGFRDGEFGVDALPVLRKALLCDDVLVSILAAECIAKLGPAAKSACGEDDDGFELCSELHRIGSKVWDYSGHCNCFAACLDALEKIAADEKLLSQYVSRNVSAVAPDELVKALEVLRRMGTKEAKELIERASLFWWPDLNLRERKAVDRIRAAVR